MRTWILLVFVATTPLTSVFADPGIVTNDAPGEMLNHATCVSGSDTRELEIIAKRNGFAVKYIHGGKSKEIGTCASNQEKCQVVFDNIRNNLIAAGYTCKM